MQTAERVQPKRKYYLDVARVIAIISITLNHAVNRCYANYSGQMKEFYALPFLSTLLKTVITVFSKLGVPLFMMITGVLILNKKMENGDDLKRYYKHNVLGMLITVELWYIIMYWYQLLFGDYTWVLQEKGLGGAFAGMIETMLFQNQITFGSMWYMPVILCIYTTLPFVIMAKNNLAGSKPSPWLFLPLIIVFLNNMILPVLNAVLKANGIPTYSSTLQMVDLAPYFYIYILLGYFVGKGTFAKWNTWIVVGIFAGTFVACCGFQIYMYAQPMDYLIDYNFPLLPLCAGALLELARRGANKLSRLEKPVTYLSRISFAIYVVHILIMTALMRKEVAAFLQYALWDPALKMVFLEVASVGLSVLIIWLLSKIKPLKKYLFLIK